MSAREVAERAARESYGRLLAWLAVHFRDLAAAEDALAEAFASALERWPAQGVPAAPERWLLTVAKRQVLDALRHQRVVDGHAATALLTTVEQAAPEAHGLADERLRLLFVCAHPALDPALHAALMLKTVLGLDAARIASAFLVKPEAMSKRLFRARQRLSEARVRFEVPEPDEWPGRVASVLEAIYGAYALHWGQADAVGAHQLAREALFLAELAAAHLPNEPEALGLYALLCTCEARRPARLDAQGAFVSLHEQDPARWDAVLLDRSERALRAAAKLGAPGPYQLEAAVQAAHTHGVRVGRVPWIEIAALYELLLALAPTVGARIGHAVAHAHAHRAPREGLARLDALDPSKVSAHQPYWAARAHMLELAGQPADAAAAWGRALALTVEPALRAWLAARRHHVDPGGRLL